MNIIETPLDGALVIEPKVFGDARGFFFETFHKDRYVEAGISEDFVQGNISRSSYGILRGLHIQNPCAQGKLVQVLEGEVYDVAVDIRNGSPSYGKWHGITLSADNHRQFYVPPGMAHGFCVTSDTALFSYKCTDFYAPQNEFTLAWDDPDLNIAWPLKDPVLSDKDTGGLAFGDLEPSKLFQFGGRS